VINSDDFYYSEAQSSIHYSRTPTGALEIKELIAGNACWIPATLPRIKKQKTLVLADWTAQTWSPHKIGRVIKSLGDLIDQGFSMCMWRDGHVSSITKQDLSKLRSLEVRKEMTLAASDTVRDVAVKENKLTVDQVHVIDNDGLNYILSDREEPEPRVLRTSEIPNLTSQEMNTLVNILKTVRPALHAYPESVCSNKII